MHSAEMLMPQPTAATTMPPNAGPTARATLNPAEFRATAEACCSAGTNSGVIACHAGSFITAPSPSRNVNSSSTHGPTQLVSVMMPSVAGSQHHPSLRQQQESPPVHHVRQRARRQDDQEHRQRSRRLHQSNHQRIHGHLRHQPARARRSASRCRYRK